MKAEDIRRILVIGSGTMGQQIAFQLALHGCDIVMYDIREDILGKGLASLRKMADEFVAQHRITQVQGDTAMKRISGTTDPAEAARGIDLVSESVPEDPKLKAEVFARFHALCPEHTIFTTNTSTLKGSLFAGATGRPGKFLAFHFHDVRLTNVVDIMPHPGTDEETVETVRDFSLRMGLNPIVMKKENTGYVFNYMLLALIHAAQTLAARGVVSVEDIDKAWMGVTRMDMGPFGIMDGIGLDTVWMVTEYWSAKSRDPQSVRNAEFLKQYVEKGALGRKSGKGFYDYPDPLYEQPGFIMEHPLAKKS